MIVILGPTASGKTQLATRLAHQLDGEVISADSRQVYKGMDIGTGKDLDEYVVEGKAIPYHLIDIVDPGYEYNVYEFQQDFLKAYYGILRRGKTPILCGGTGLYIESVLKGYRLPRLEHNPELEALLHSKTTEELVDLLKTLREQHNTTDILDRKRLIKAIRIGLEESRRTEHYLEFPEINARITGIALPREVLRERITQRLHHRLEHGMIEEVDHLLASGISPETLTFYGLEYRFITLYLMKQLSYEEMKAKLNIGIHQFAKRQMTWFRRMERNGFDIHWIDMTSPLKEQVAFIRSYL
ncbi:MAG: tRNA (adenosine(37)-N6)-dimethylallyltransferase MiaA [Bacteroidales bacterium]|nr:tRNA (adenosine(37)-N6)-dimethylallyltransferase MiaA [Bacteroidales bacterium]